MKELQLRYGQGHVQLKIPDDNIGEIIQPRKQEASKDIAGSLRSALATPMQTTLSEIITNRRVGVLVEDGTRAPQLFQQLELRTKPIFT